MRNYDPLMTLRVTIRRAEEFKKDREQPEPAS
jgi:hypothetical protein